MAGSKKVQSQTSAKSSRSEFVKQFAEFLRAIKTFADPYRPELHYMRGPGPKYRAKHGSIQEAIADHPGLASVKG